MTEKKVAIVYDWADTRYGGAEQVLLELHRLYPEAPLYTAFVTPAAAWTQKFPRVYTSFIQKFPAFWRRQKKYLSPFLPLAFETFNFDQYDLIISVSSFAAKGILTKPHQLHIDYLLTPTRFLYSHTQEYLPSSSRLTQAVSRYLRHYDHQAAWRPDKMIAISRLVAKRAQEYYQRQVDDIIYPTIIDKSAENDNIDKISSTNLPAKYFLCVGRLTPYKHLLDVATICGQQHFPLIIIGDGPQKKSLEESIKQYHWDQIQLLTNVDSATVQTYYRHALALVAPGLEDFGINLLEANQAGTLVITHPDSGARELLDEQQASDLDPQDLTDSLATTLTKIYQQDRILVNPQSLLRQDFRRLWREKVATYENE